MFGKVVFSGWEMRRIWWMWKSFIYQVSDHFSESSFQDVAEQWLPSNMWPIIVKKQNFDQAWTHAKKVNASHLYHIKLKSNSERSNWKLAMRTLRLSEKFLSWYINLRGLFNAKDIILVEQKCCYLSHCWEDKGVHTFPKDICPKVSLIARLEFELAYYHSVV